MTSLQNNPSDTFWLARYAHNQLEPLFTQAKTIEPSLMFMISLTFADAGSAYDRNHVSVYAHWDRDGMFQYSTFLRTTADVDRLATKVKADVANLEPLDVTA
jgi:hypothetical protein